MNINVSKVNKPRMGSGKRFLLMLSAMGPGIVVMLADTDAGSIITAAQTGAQWGYKLIGLMLILIPILYIVQELTTRIGIVTKKGHGELIEETFGKGWAWLSVCTLFVSTIGALITEFSGIMGVGLLFGVSKWITVPLAVAALILLSVTGKYKVVERVAIVVGAFELVFIPAMIFAKPDYTSVMMSLVGSQPLNSSAYWLMISANVGAVIMPWMVFYQQGAVVDKGLTEKNLKASRIDTIFGSIITQLICCVVIIAVAATIGMKDPNASLNTVQQISQALTPFLGEATGKILFAVGLTGAALVAAIVVTLASSWGFGEIFKKPSSLNCKWSEAPAFYIFYSTLLIIAGIIVLSGIPLVPLTLGVEILNTVLLPIVLGFLIALAWKVLPKKHALHLWEKIILIIIYIVITVLGVLTLYLTF
ncbi:MAG: divalent metal cation transporter [Sarcina ventriculi]|uniref:Divalent metal cation transporter n=2 Tax=Sarcina TaxID=1266 RepID=A0ACD1BDF5_9CLOT|nr:MULTISPECIES: divalent metal cation transporter [Sarcina]MDO4402216.1 divalent metal cation transporter [Clostridiaceae bacterium]MBU5322082.1 divalent metal cation transporter [Sarcina ventriculi]MCI5636318.1 divalent metal cation transporter [Sarcina ventriculi]MDD7374013.1 divalent metal cation transporter [Sarcina ventriculi]MDY7062071.1 divalent metal cation transporter [Sarcina ventriculi]